MVRKEEAEDAVVAGVEAAGVATVGAEDIGEEVAGTVLDFTRRSTTTSTGLAITTPSKETMA